MRFRPARVPMQDFTGVPAVVDLEAMRGACESGRLDKLIEAHSPRHVQKRAAPNFP